MSRVQQPSVYRTCQVCGAAFSRYVSPSRQTQGANRFCSRQCKGKGLSGKHHPMWKGGRIVEADGYVMLHRPDHPHANNKGYVFEQRLVMEAHLGRYLEPHEVVHHENENRSDNRLDNLELYDSQKGHMIDHYGMTVEAVIDVFRLRKAGWTQDGIAERLGVSQAQVHRILNRKRRSEVQIPEELL